MAFQLGALDFCKIFPPAKPVEALWDTLELAPVLESYGYVRYWLAEHHSENVAHSTPEILVPVLAGLTQHMHIGTAGTLLRFHSPLRIAKSFRLLSALFPGRIDLGLARGGVSAAVQKRLLPGSHPDSPEATSEDYEQRAEELLGYLRGTGAVQANPTGIAPPEVWTLGSGSSSMHLAARHGTAFCLSLFLQMGPRPLDSEAIVNEYHARFQPSADVPAPRCSVAVAGVCAETEAAARRICSAYGDAVTPTVAGTPEQCRAMFDELAARHRTNEFIFLDLSPTLAERMRSYRLLAEALGLSGAPVAVVANADTTH
jgi:luciferase family oxidoreductase group 1